MSESSTELIKKRAELVQLHLPTCYKGYSALPNVFFGNSLFAATGGKSKSEDAEPEPVMRKENAQVEIISSSKRYQIFYTGEQLAQSDLSFYLKLIPLYGLGKMKLGESCWINLHEFLVDGYKTLNSQTYARLEEKIIRLYNAEVAIIRPGIPPYFCRLISGRSEIFTGKGNKKIIEITLDPILREAFLIDGYSFINLTERSALGNNQLALWIHSYYARHAKPYPITAEFVYEKSGSKAKEFARWVRRSLSPALDKINDFNGWNLYIDLSSGVDESKIFCKEKPTTTSQQKYLSKKGEKSE